MAHLSASFKKVLAAVAIGSFFLAACSSTDQQTEPSSSSTETSAEKVKIKWWAWNPGQGGEQAYLDAFAKDYPDIEVEFRFIQYSDYTNAVKMALTSGTGPDVFGVQVGTLTTQFAPLAEDLTSHLEQTVGGDWNQKITATNQLNVEGKQVAVPLMVTGGGLIWSNQKVLDELNLEVPTNLAQLESFCATVKAAGKTCWTQGAKDGWQNIDVYQAIMNQIAPGEFYKATEGETSFDSPDFVKGFEVWKSLFDKGIFQDGALGNTAYPDANDAFSKGEAALIAFGTWQNGNTTNATMDVLAETYGDQMRDSIFMPHFFPQLVEGGTTGTLFGGPDVGFAVAAGSKQKEAALTFATWLATAEGSQSIVAKQVTAPANSDFDLDYSDVISEEQIVALKEQGPALSQMVGPRQIQSAEVESALADALSSVAAGIQTPTDAAKSVQVAIK